RRQRDLCGDRQAPAKAPGGPGCLESSVSDASVLFLTLAEIAERAAFLAPRAGRGQQAPRENRNSARWGVSASLSLWKRPLTGPRLGYVRCRAALSPHAAIGFTHLGASV